MKTISHRPTVLCILDGLGLNPNSNANAVALANKPTIDKLMQTSPFTTLITHGTRVGLPEGHMGNSEVGHLNIGAGRVVEQWLYRITREFDSGFLDRSKVLNKFLSALKKDSKIHLIGLFSTGGVHSHADLLFQIINRLEALNFKNLAIHVILDGRDTSPTVGASDLKNLLEFLKDHPLCKIASLCGRFYAMDRDKRWERTKLAWDAIVESTSNKITDPLVYLEECYSKGISDEFIDPVVVDGSVINKDDGLLFWNFRTDRMKQIVAAMTQENFTEFDRKGHIHSKERSLCLTEYDPNFQIPFLFEAIEIPNHLGEVISNLGLKQLRTAETEKYPHVTYFLNGLFEGHLVGEDRKVIPSPRDIKTYDLKPEMSAFGVRDVVLEAIKSGKHDLIIVNFANCDMVGHTGILKAAIKAVETVDQCLGEILSELSKVSGQALIIADHGNAEQMVNYETGEPHTSHTTYPVPAILFGANKKITKLRDGGALCDVAPTILKMMELSQPKEMTGKSLF